MGDMMIRSVTSSENSSDIPTKPLISGDHGSSSTGSGDTFPEATSFECAGGSSTNFDIDRFLNLDSASISESSGMSSFSMIGTRNHWQPARIDILYKRKGVYERIVKSTLEPSPSIGTESGKNESRSQDKQSKFNFPGPLWENSMIPMNKTKTRKLQASSSIPKSSSSIITNVSASTSQSQVLPSQRKRKANSSICNASSTDPVFPNKIPKLSSSLGHASNNKFDLSQTASMPNTVRSEIPDLSKSISDNILEGSTSNEDLFSQKHESKTETNISNGTELALKGTKPNTPVENVFLKKYDPIKILARLRSGTMVTPSGRSEVVGSRRKDLMCNRNDSQPKRINKNNVQFSKPNSSESDSHGNSTASSTAIEGKGNYANVKPSLGKFQLHQSELPSPLTIRETKFSLAENPSLLHTIELIRHKREIQDMMESLDSENVVYKVRPLPKLPEVPLKKQSFVTSYVPIAKREVKHVLSQRLLINLALVGFTHAKLRPLEVLADIVAQFLSETVKRLKDVVEMELHDIDHGFPDAMERVLTENGMGGIRGLEEFYQKKFMDLRKRMEEECLNLRSQYAHKIRSKY